MEDIFWSISGGLYKDKELKCGFSLLTEILLDLLSSHCIQGRKSILNIL